MLHSPDPQLFLASIALDFRDPDRMVPLNCLELDYYTPWRVTISPKHDNEPNKNNFKQL